MRISSNLFFQTGLNSINAQQSDLLHLYKQVGSGQRMVTPSDDPLAAAQAINVSQTLAMSERYAANRQVASRNLGMQDNILSSVVMQLQDVKTQLVEAGNGTWSDIDRATLAEVFEAARDSLLNLANSTDGNGQYLFSGAKGKTAAFSASGAYQGSSDPRLVQVDQTRLLDSADIGSNIFSRAAPGTVGYVTVPNTGNTGMAAVSGYDITNDVGLAAGRAMQFEFVDDLVTAGSMGYRVTIPTESGTPLVYEADLPVAAADGSYTVGDPALGLSVTLNGIPANGDGFEMVPLHSPHYTVETSGGPAMVRSVSGYDGSAQLSMVYEEDPLNPGVWGFTVDGTHYPSAIDPLTNRVSVNIDGVAVEFDAEPDPGQSFTITAGPDSQSRNDLSLFNALDDIIGALRSGTGTPAASVHFQNTLNSAMQRVDAVYNNVLSVRASAGTRMNEVTALDSAGGTRI
ncbi:MAG: flagellar hook-associated protein FlgL, partial [Burkholderiaceae bacterium]